MLEIHRTWYIQKLSWRRNHHLILRLNTKLQESRQCSTCTESSKRSMKRNREPRKRAIPKWSFDLQQRSHRSSTGKGKFFNDGAGATGWPCRKKRTLDLCVTPYTNIYPRWITDLNSTAKTMKLTKKPTRRMSSPMRQAVGLDRIQKAITIKDKIKNFCSSKDVIKKRNRHTENWEKIALNYIWHRTDVQGMYKVPYNPILTKK